MSPNECTRLAAKAVQSATLTLECVDDVHRRDSLATCVFGVRDGVTNDVLEEHLEHAACLLVDEIRDTLHTATTCETTNGWLRDTLRINTTTTHGEQSVVISSTNEQAERSTKKEIDRKQQSKKHIHLNVITQHFAMALGTTLSETFSSCVCMQHDSS